MQYSFEHQATQFAVNVEFESFSTLKHAFTPRCSARCLRIHTREGRFRTVFSQMQRQGLFLVPPCNSIDRTDLWQIRKSIQTHTYHGINHSVHRNIDEEFISTEILPKLRLDPKFTPKAIQNHLKDQYGVDILYHKAYRAKEHAIKLINGSHKEAYNCLPNTVMKFSVRIQEAQSGWISIPRQIGFNVCLFALLQVLWALLIVALCSVLMVPI